MENNSTDEIVGLVSNPPTIVRRRNTTIMGEPFEEHIISEVWQKAKKEFGLFFYRRDMYGDIIARHEFGMQNKYGWEIDHILPVVLGGTDDIENLQPLHWKNNQTKNGLLPNEKELTRI